LSSITTVDLKAAAYDLTCQIRASNKKLEEVNQELLNRKELIVDVEVTPNVRD
jgi:hypothetical protein